MAHVVLRFFVGYLDVVLTINVVECLQLARHAVP
jgi:hypothetical protein